MKFISIVSLLFAFNTSVSAQGTTIIADENTDWQKIALTIVNFNQGEKDILIAGKEKYMSIHFRVATGQVDIKSLEVFYENGNKQDIAVNEIVKAAANSRVLDLNGEGRILKKIVMKYQAVANTDDREARMELWASRKVRSRQ